MNNEKKFIKLTPFKMQVLQSFPFIDADFDALTNYELLCKVVEYLNTTVDNVDLLNEKVEEFEHYFDNLDVQEEINNKLDEMAESGQLTDIIAQYLGLAGVLSFNTVNDMKNATNLVNGSTCKTLGYYNINDGGNALYKIRNITNQDVVNDMDIISLNNTNLIAELMVKDTINIRQIGAYGDNTHDDTEKLNFALSKWTWKNVYLPAGNYKVTNTINITEGKNIFGDGMFISSIRYEGTTKAIEMSNNYYGITNIKNISLIKNGGYIEGDTTSIGFNISKGTNNRNVTNLYMDHVAIRYFAKNLNSSVAGILLNSNFTNCLFEGGYDNCYIVGGYNNYFDKCRFGEGVRCGYFQQSGEGRFNNCSFEGNHRAVRIANSGGSYSFINCFFENIDNTQKSNHSCISIEAGDLASIDNISIIDSHFYGCYRQIYLEKVKKVTLINNTMFNPGIQCVGYNYTDTDIESIVFINNNFSIKPYDKSTFVNFIEDNQDTGWVTINTSQATRGTFHNFQMRRIGKLVKWRGFVDNIKDSDKNNTFGITIPDKFRPSNDISCTCPMSQGNQGNFIQLAGFLIGSSGFIKLQGYNASSNVQNQISFDMMSYYTE